MTALVDHGIEGGEHIVLVVMGGDAGVILVETRGEGVLCLPDGAAASVDAHEGHDPVREDPLGRDREDALQEARIGCGSRRHLFQQGDDLPAERGKEGIALPHGEATLIKAKQHVVRLLVRLVVSGKSPVRRHDLLQVGGEGLEVVCGLCPVPYVAGLVEEHLVLHELLLRDAGGVVQIPGEDLHFPVFTGVQRIGMVPELRNKAAGTVSGGKIVLHAAEDSQGPAPSRRGGGGGGGVPVIIEEPHGVVIGVDSLLQLPELLKGLSGIHTVHPFPVT